MRPYLGTIKGILITWIVYRFGFFLTLLGNLLYMMLIFSLWKSIYTGMEIIHGMTFNQTFIYLALAGSLFAVFSPSTDWMIASKIVDGSLIVDLLKPLDFQYMTLARTVGYAIFNAIVITIPSLLILFLAFRAEMKVGIGLIFFPIGFIMAFLISFAIDFSVGMISFYTESIWGINMTKGIITSLLSGALVPLQFFPEAVQNVLRLLPFQAIYNIPLTMVISPDLDISTYVQALAIQVFWVVALFVFSRWFYNRAFKVLTVSGG
jgi:ABC-2 type transport system permease protein